MGRRQQLSRWFLAQYVRAAVCLQQKRWIRLTTAKLLGGAGGAKARNVCGEIFGQRAFVYLVGRQRCTKIVIFLTDISSSQGVQSGHDELHRVHRQAAGCVPARTRKRVRNRSKRRRRHAFE